MRNKTLMHPQSYFSRHLCAVGVLEKQGNNSAPGFPPEPAFNLMIGDRNDDSSSEERLFLALFEILFVQAKIVIRIH